MPPIVCSHCKARGKFVETSDVVTPNPNVAKPKKRPTEPAKVDQPAADRKQADLPKVAPQKPEPRKPEPSKPEPSKPEPRVSTAGETKPRQTEVSAPTNLLWRHSPPKPDGSEPHPLRGCPAVDGEGRAFAAIDSDLVAFSMGRGEPDWTYSTGGPILGSPALGTDGNVRVHSTDGFLHLVQGDGSRMSVPAEVGPPLGWAMPMVDAKNRTWIAQSTGGIFPIDADGEPARRPFYRTRRRFDCVGVIRQDVLYIGCEDHFVHAIPLTDEHGENIWDQRPNAGRTGGAINCPLVVSSHDELLVVSQDGMLHAFDWNGDSKWTFPIPGQVHGSPVVDHDGTILLGISRTPRHRSMTGSILAIDGATHRQRWEYKVDAPVESTPVIGDDSVIYFGDNAGTLYAIDGPNQLLWKSSFDAQVRSGGTFMAPKIVCFGLDDGSLVALQASSQGLLPNGWPKMGRTLDQSGTAADR